MTRRTSQLLLATAAALVLTGPAPCVAQAGFGQILKGTNFAAFSDADMKIFLNTAETTVGSQPEGVDVRWNSPKSGASGNMRVVSSFERGGLSCRQLGGDTTVKSNTEPFSITYCRDPNGHWRLASPK